MNRQDNMRFNRAVHPSVPRDNAWIFGARKIGIGQGSPRTDIAVADGVVKFGKWTGPYEPSEVIDASDCIVTPGLVDIHAHVFAGLRVGADPDAACLMRGTTTAVDAGTAGANTLELFKGVVDRANTRVLAWLHLSTIGLVDPNFPELLALHHVNVDAAVEAARATPELIVGFKAFVSSARVGWSCKPVLKLLREAADAANLPVMVHIGGSHETLPEVLEFMRGGDVVTHSMTKERHGVLDDDGRILSEVIQAQRLGIVFDIAPGTMHLSFDVLAACLEQGFVPDTISTDITRHTAEDADFSMPMFGSAMLAFGLSLDEVIARMTRRPAAVIRRPELTDMAEGHSSDLTFLEIKKGEFRMKDSSGRVRQLTERLVPFGVIRKGRYYDLRRSANLSVATT